MNLKPLNDRIIVRREAAEEKSAGGILLPDTAEEAAARHGHRRRPRQAEQEDGTRVPMQLKAGDKVLFTSWAGDEFKDRNSRPAKSSSCTKATSSPSSMIEHRDRQSSQA